MPSIVDPAMSAAHIEAIVLDPSEVATGRTEFDISNIIKSDGVDWGDAAIEAYLAEAMLGQVPVDFRVPNRIISIPLVIKDTPGVTFDVARRVMQAKVGLFHREGGWLKREINGTPLYADVVNATLKLGGSTLQALRSFDIDATLSLECLPEFYGDEITLDNMTETTATELVKVLKLSAATAVIKGDYPARTRIVVDEDQGASQRGLLWGLRSRYYDSAATAALAYEAEALTPLDAATIVTQTGSSGGGTNNAVKHPALSSDWTPVLSTTHAVSGALTHKGSYRVWARVYSPATTVTAFGALPPARPRARFVWDVGDLTVPAVNDPVTLPATSTYCDVDLGEVRLDAAPVGTHRWFGMVQAAGGVGGETFYVDKLWFIPIAEGYGALRSGSTTGQDLAAYAARDGFAQTSGALAAKTLPIGGTWSGAGDTDDFSVTGSGTVQRTAVSDIPTTGDVRMGRWAIAGSSTYSNVFVQVTNVSFTTPGSNDPNWGVFARYVDINNWVLVYVLPSLFIDGVNAQTAINPVICVGGTITSLGNVAYPAPQLDAGQKTILRMYVEESGRLRAWFYDAGVVDSRAPIVDVQAVDLASGSTIATGKVGFFDLAATATAKTRVYDDFLAWAPTPDAVMYASQSVQLRSDGMIREDSTGTSYGPVSSVVGDLPRLPPSGIENRTVELFLKATRGNLDQLADTNIDDISAQVFYRPCWLFVPA